MASIKNKTNGFMTFVFEWRQNNPEALGMSMPQAVNRCGDIWKMMSHEERSPYVLKAKSINLQMRGQSNHRLVQMDRARREAEERLEEMKLVTRSMVMEAVKANDLENTNFVFIAFNYFTKAMSGDFYIPAEFSACQFSLKQGIVSWYTTLINPGSIDLGQASDALHHSSTTHNLPLPPHALGERNMKKLYKEIHGYLTSCLGEKPLIVFTKAENLAKVQASLYDLQVKSHQRGKDIRVHTMEYLLFCLKKQVLQIAGLPVDDITELFTETYLNQDLFALTPHIACKYHEDIDRSQYCTLAIGRSWSYAFCDFLCEDLNIPKKRGKHIPRGENCDDDRGHRKDKESVLDVKKCLAGFGRGRTRTRLPSLGEANS